MERRSRAREHLDGHLELDLLRGNLRDLARVNRWLGGADLTWRALRPILGEAIGATPLRLLDVGTGAADIPVELARRASSSGMSLEIVATDVRPEIVDLAREAVAKTNVRVELGQPDRIDSADNSYDVVHASLVLHHLEPEAAVGLLRDMGRVASRAVVINDLDRADHWYLLARVLAAVTTANPYTRHDGPLSVERAYRPTEIRDLAWRANLREVDRYWTKPAYRYALVFRP